MAATPLGAGKSRIVDTRGCFFFASLSSFLSSTLLDGPYDEDGHVVFPGR